MTGPSDFRLPSASPTAPPPPQPAAQPEAQPMTDEQVLAAGYSHLDHVVHHWLGENAAFDENGWLPMNRQGQQFGLNRFHDPANQVWVGAVAVALAGVEESVELYRDLVQANRELNLAKVGWHDKQIWVAGEIAVLPWLRPEDVMLLAERVTGGARAVGELFGPRYGGEVPPEQQPGQPAPTVEA